MAEEHLPEDIIVKILSKLPVKSLLRFRCVSKRWRSIVSDPQFTRLQFKVACEQQTLSHRLLFCSGTSQFETLDLEMTSFQANSLIRKRDLPFPLDSRVNLLCSCNGLVCVALDSNSFYIWNPSIGFIHRLPDSVYSSKRRLRHYGFGYVSATDDYKLLLVADAVIVDCLGVRREVEVVEVFSLRARIWKKIEAGPFDCIPQYRAVLSNEALHWPNWIGHDYALALAGLDSDEEYQPAVIAFDLAREEFREMPVPFIAEYNYSFTDVGESCDGCLYMICSAPPEPLEFWVMREYGVGDSWTKLYNFNTCNSVPEQIELEYLNPILIMRRSAVVIMNTDSGLELVRIDHHEEKLGETSTVAARCMIPGYRYDMIGYEETLFWLSDYLGAEEKKVASKRFKTQHKASKS